MPEAFVKIIVVSVDEDARSCVEETVPLAARIAVEEVHVKFVSEEIEDEDVQNVTCVEVPLPIAGGVTVQFVSPGAQEGLRVSPGA